MLKFLRNYCLSLRHFSLPDIFPNYFSFLYNCMHCLNNETKISENVNFLVPFGLDGNQQTP